MSSMFTFFKTEEPGKMVNQEKHKKANIKHIPIISVSTHFKLMCYAGRYLRW